MKDKQVTERSQHGFVKEKSCLTNLFTYYNEVTSLIDDGRAVDDFYFNFSKAFGHYLP